MTEKQAGIPTIIMPPSYSRGGDDVVRPSKVKKWVAIGAAAALLLVLTIGGVMLVLHFNHQNAKDILVMEKRLEDGSTEKARVGKGEEDYDLPSKQFHVHHDFRRMITVYRMKLDGKLACYIKRITERDNLTSTNTNDEEVSVRYKASAEPVNDRSILSETAQEICASLDAHWLIFADDAESSTAVSAGGRNKRRACYYLRYCYYRRIWGRWYRFCWYFYRCY